MTTTTEHPRDPDSPTADVSTAGARDPGVGGPLRQLMLRLHFYVGLLVGPFLLIAAVSGFFYALAPTIEKVVYADQLTATSSAQNVPLADQITTARAFHPDLAVARIVAGSDGSTTRVLFSDDSLPSESHSRVVFVDPSDGAIRGDTVQYGSGQALPLRTWLSGLHRSLHLGEVGRLYSELAASWLAPLALAGLYLWWGRTRRAGTTPFRSAPGLEGRARLRSRHAVLGTWALVGMLVLSATGLTWSAYAGQRVADLRAALDWTTPTLSATSPESSSAGTALAEPANGHHDHGSHAGSRGVGSEGAADWTPDGAQVALAGARSAGLTDPVQLVPPTADGDPWRVQEARRSWTPGPDAVSIDPATGGVVQSIPFSGYPVAAKLTDWGIRLHMGFLFGLANQLLLAAVAAAAIVVTLRGYSLWWTRRPTRTRGLARPPVRGAAIELLRRRPLATLVGAIVVAAIGWAVPLLGISLAAFLVLDALVGLAARRARG
ncbi:peptidase [Dietzia natronolimnaea]|uniref:Peptidase n=1 Tax=Dietzia natronolimnaea TaxID=161920 RepID=A0A2A2WP18_9ACTN|nr:PepSY domain-containing protein [Dietzia natronolimnaea]PAY22905.1 peptidase [Dietzia natronolimnaea]